MHPPGAGDGTDELAEVGPVLERREDAPQLVALGELRRGHHVEEADAEDLLDGRCVVLAKGADDALADQRGRVADVGLLERSGERASAAAAVMPVSCALRRPATALSDSWSAGSSSEMSDCLMSPRAAP